MEILEKLQVLSDAAKYDVSCSSSGGKRKNENGIGNSATPGICHSFAADRQMYITVKNINDKCVHI